MGFYRVQGHGTLEILLQGFVGNRKEYMGFRRVQD